MASAANQVAAGLNWSSFSKASDLKKRLWFTIGALIVYRLCTFVPLPGIDPVQLGVVVIFNLTLGLMTPPVCLVLQMLAQVGNLNFGRVLKATLPLLGILFIVLLIVTYVPALTLTLPRLLGV